MPHPGSRSRPQRSAAPNERPTRRYLDAAFKAGSPGMTTAWGKAQEKKKKIITLLNYEAVGGEFQAQGNLALRKSGQRHEAGLAAGAARPHGGALPAPQGALITLQRTKCRGGESSGPGAASWHGPAPEDSQHLATCPHSSAALSLWD